MSLRAFVSELAATTPLKGKAAEQLLNQLILRARRLLAESAPLHESVLHPALLGWDEDDAGDDSDDDMDESDDDLDDESDDSNDYLPEVVIGEEVPFDELRNRASTLMGRHCDNGPDYDVGPPGRPTTSRNYDPMTGPIDEGDGEASWDEDNWGA